MKFFSRIVQSALLITTPTLIACPTSETPIAVIQQATPQPIRIPDLHTLSYDEVVDLLALIESDSFEDRYSMDELDELNKFISFLAREGAAEDEKIDIENSIASLFRKNNDAYALFANSEFGYTADPAIYVEGTREVIPCKSWFSKQWKATKDFVKNHKKAIIIGTIVAVTAAVVVVAAIAISASAASAAAAAGALSSAGTVTDHSEAKQESLASSFQEQASTFKETIAKEQFAAAPESNGISIEENGRIVGSLFAHKTIDAMTANLAQNPSIANELKDFGLNSQYPTPTWLPTHPITPHSTTDCAFSTDYRTTYATNSSDLNMLSYQARGDLALSSECFVQAVQDFGSAIAIDPSNPILYLERGIASFELGDYEHSVADYTQYVEKRGAILTATDFTIGFGKGVPKGVYESGKGALLFLSHLLVHPVQTSCQMVDALAQLMILVNNDEFSVIAEALSPELHQLVTQWDSLPVETRGELAGYALGKVGADLLAPGAAAKVASKSVSSAKELVAICKNLQIAQETLVLETASGIGSSVKIAELIEVGKKTAALGEELGFTAREIGQLQQAGKLETTVSNAYQHLSPAMRESYEFFKRAENFLEQHKGFMPEAKARKLIRRTGVRTFSRPQGIPENFRVKISDKGAGMKYVHPHHTHTYIRVMPGKPHSPLPHQQKPYVNQTRDGKALDKFGNIVNGNSPEAHIPYNEFVYRN